MDAGRPLIVYLDSSVILRHLLQEAGQIPAWGSWKWAVSSALLEVEVHRILDRKRLTKDLRDEEVAFLRGEFHSLKAGLEVIPLSQAVLQRASQSFPTSLKTLDALHIASALLWTEDTGKPLVFLTHDHAQETAARALGLGPSDPSR